jgi:putative ABC transport system permease protein
VFAALYGSLRARRGDLAILRCLGATRWELLIALLLEGLLLSLFGVALGFLAGHGAMELLGGWLESTRGVALTGWTWIPAETLLLFGLFGVGTVAAAIPAAQAYRTDVARTLAEA